MVQPSQDPSATEVFISYRTKEHTAAEAELLHGYLVKRRINVFFDSMRLAPGDRWDDVIRAAAASPKLAVGVVLMTDGWFQNFAADLERDVVWREVGLLRARQRQQRQERRHQEQLGRPHPAADVRLIPVVLRSAETGDRPPRPPEATHPHQAQLIELGTFLEELHYCWVPPKGPRRMDQLVEEITQAVRFTVLGRPLRDAISAEQTAPLPLSTLKREPATQRGLLDYADQASAYRQEHRFMTLRGQDALLTRDWSEALVHLTRAKSNMEDDEPVAESGDDASATFRADLWRIHLLNLYFIASLRGDRPRRRQITEASLLLRTLVKAVHIGALRLDDCPRGTDQLACADRRSAAYVLEMTLDLLWLLWQDFFIQRNVRLPGLARAELEAIRRWLDQVGQTLDSLHHGSERLSGATAERRFLVDKGYLDGLPHDPDAPERWVPPDVLGGLTTLVDKELGA